MKKVLIVVAVASSRPDNMNWLPLRDAIQKQVNCDVDMSSLTNLVFDISNDKCSVIDTLSKNDVADYDFVVIRNVGKTPELGIALANYLKIKNIPFTDSYLDTRGSGKLTCSILRSCYDLSTPRTVYALPANLVSYIKSINDLPYPIILKADNGKKGRNNYLVKSLSELESRLSEQPDVPFIVQEFIENDGDYRALVINNKISVVIKRTAGSTDTHLNNTSQGGSAVLESTDIFSKKVQEQILLAAHIEGLEVAGVDIIFDKKSNGHYFLEVNRAPQIGTGAYADEKIAAYAKMIDERVQNA